MGKERRIGLKEAKADLDRKLPYPKGVFFITATELSERFSYYGMRAVLTIYMRNMLSFDENEATSYYHIFLMLCYGLPIFWGVISDSWLGKFRTILYVSILFGLGNIVLALSSVPPLNLPTKEFFFVGLFLMAVGTGGMKPCVAPLGGEQFVLPQQENQLKQFFSFFFFAITIGNMVSTVITPIFRRDITCFGSDSCYPLAFGVPASIMIVAVVTFVAGRPLYTVNKPSGNMLVQVTKCIAHALSNRRRKSITAASSSHWLDYASDEFDSNLINDTKGLLRVLVYYLPIPMFFALYEQLGSRWTLQATRMNGTLGGFSIKPDQMQVANAILMFIFLPVFQYAIYPLFGKCGVFKRPLQRMVVGGILAALSFTVAGIVELKIEPTIKSVPAHGHSVVTFANSLPCSANVIMYPNSPMGNYTIGSNDYTTLPELQFENPVPLSIKTTGNSCGLQNGRMEWTGEVNIPGGVYQSVGIAMLSDGSLSVNTFPFQDEYTKSKDGNARVRLVDFMNFRRRFIMQQDLSKSHLQQTTTLGLVPTKGDKTKFYTLSQKDSIWHSDVEEIAENEYHVILQTSNSADLNQTFSLENGGSYNMILSSGQSPGEITSQLVVIAPPNSIHILWLLPQYILMAWGEILFIVSGMEFSFTEAPVSMKSVLQALWHLMNACGNVIVIIAASNHGQGSQAVEFFIFSGLMFLDAIVFAFMAMRYKYVSSEDEKPAALH